MVERRRPSRERTRGLSIDSVVLVRVKCERRSCRRREEGEGEPGGSEGLCGEQVKQMAEEKETRKKNLIKKSTKKMELTREKRGERRRKGGV